MATLVLLAACNPDNRHDDDGDDDDTGHPAVDAALPDARANDFIDAAALPDGSTAPPDPDGVVYGHSASALYKIDPETYAVTQVAPFHWPADTFFEQMTDIAIDKHGVMTGVSFTKVYRVDPDTGDCTFLANLDRQFNGLSYVPDGAGGERLVGATTDGSVWGLDPTTGASTLLGNYGTPYTSSGDLVYVEGFGAVATVKHNGVGPDFLVRVDPDHDFQASPIGGELGFSDIWGLGFWKGKVFGFSGNSQFVLINPVNGTATLLAQGANVSWWGAGVTTAAPIIP
jgi:hypothetical protein